MPLWPQQNWKQMVVGGDRQIAERFGVDPITARVLLNRGLRDEDQIRKFLHGTLEDLEDPRSMDQLEEAARLLHECILQNRKIRIIGDYDADGILSVYILYASLRQAGADVSYDIPDRFADGFGMSMRLVEKAHHDGINTIITCDNGIAQNAEISCAKQLGMTVILTDHHEPNFRILLSGEKEYLLPEADVIVDPKKPGCRYPNKNLCGASVAWKLMYLYECRYMRAGADDKDNLPPVSSCPMTMANLPFAAAATVTDLMKLTGENRILVKYGLKLLPETENIGMRALIRNCNLEGKKLTAGHIAFSIGPCLNASGRLDTASRAVSLLLETDPEEADAASRSLYLLNERRKEMTEEGLACAFEKIAQASDARDRVLVLYLEETHESVAGIIASKIKETLHQPVIVFTDTENPDHLKGSGRSIEAYNMHDELSKVSDLFVRFGGHPMAAGLTIPRSSFEPLQKRLNENCSLTQEDLTQKVLLDAVPPFAYLRESLVRELEQLEPFGSGMRAPLLGCSKVRVLRLSVVGKNRNCIRMLVEDGSCKMTAVWFGDADAFLLTLEEKFGKQKVAALKMGLETDIRLTLAYRPVINDFRGISGIQLQIAYFQ